MNYDKQRRNYYSIFLTGIIASLLIVWSCKKKSDDDCPVCPVVESIAPMSGHKGDVITITGSKFLSTGNTVLFNGVSAEVIEESENRIRAKVPSKCGTGVVTVKLDEDLVSNESPLFTYLVTEICSLYAGVRGTPGSSNGSGFPNIKFYLPSRLAVDIDKNLYVIDQNSTVVRKIDSTGSSSTITSSIPSPNAIAVDEHRTVFVSGYSQFNSTIYSISYSSFDPDTFYIDNTNYRRHVSLTSLGGNEFYIARNKNGTSSYDVVHLLSGTQNDFLSDTIGGDDIFYFNNSIYLLKTIPASYTTLSRFPTDESGGIPILGSNSTFNNPEGLVVTSNGDIYISDTDNGQIKRYSYSSGSIDIVKDSLEEPWGITIDKDGNIYFAEYLNHCIWKITIE